MSEQTDTFDYSGLAAHVRAIALPHHASDVLRTRIEAAFVPKEWRDCQVNAGRQLVVEATARAEAAEARNKVLEEALRERIRVACGDWCNPETGKHDAGCENARQALGAGHGK